MFLVCKKIVLWPKHENNQSTGFCGKQVLCIPVELKRRKVNFKKFSESCN